MDFTRKLGDGTRARPGWWRVLTRRRGRARVERVQQVGANLGVAVHTGGRNVDFPVGEGKVGGVGSERQGHLELGGECPCVSGGKWRRRIPQGGLRKLRNALTGQLGENLFHKFGGRLVTGGGRGRQCGEGSWGREDGGRREWDEGGGGERQIIR